MTNLNFQNLLLFEDTHYENSESEILVQIAGASWNRGGCQMWHRCKLCAIPMWLLLLLFPRPYFNAVS